ncbi:hypothetical protein SAICODRAFT_35707 [Saitoella complicata NRRL Y-17804]|uniref:uncharacterized protein n=1 Tax=Saitoella complicata (strain BCRC 22490 / CBS 7301 / JCM 7358 / NBRC 10748 / NRRL Y-17804) TaxID=698492 RepID=UPI000867788C|nr:uncharacterized protein SAICODRAFT_35707 [Saitoella complicata NRRL Y-17804]ODQ52288.1 hypothetical protein SAICODRAFT_35707 [Saitoella complicata NRRL Y-17804]
MDQASSGVSTPIKKSKSDLKPLKALRKFLRKCRVSPENQIDFEEVLNVVLEPTYFEHQALAVNPGSSPPQLPLDDEIGDGFHPSPAPHILEAPEDDEVSEYDEQSESRRKRQRIAQNVKTYDDLDSDSGSEFESGTRHKNRTQTPGLSKRRRRTALNEAGIQSLVDLVSWKEQERSPAMRRLRRKILLRKRKASLPNPTPPFSIETILRRMFRAQPFISPFDLPAAVRETFESGVHPTPHSQERIDECHAITRTPYENSFLSRLHGISRPRGSLILRDTTSTPPQLFHLQELLLRTNPTPSVPIPPPSPIDYLPFSRAHLSQANALLQSLFWPGIELTDYLSLDSGIGVVALYRSLLVGCAFATPEGYISYVGTRPNWDRAGIGKFMVWYLVERLGKEVGVDVTLHVRADNPAMVMYQRFGFKPEAFIVDFYDKFVEEGSDVCKNAMLLRLRR